MTERKWLACGNPILMLLWTITHPHARKRRLFAVACCRRIATIMTDAGKRAVDAAEAFADGDISERKLHNAWRRVGFPKTRSRASASAAARAASASPDSDYAIQAAACAAQARKKTVEQVAQVALIRDIFGNPFRPVTFSPEWRTDTAVSLARGMYESRDFGAMPILADALQDAGCDSDDVLNHCRTPGEHVRGCWVVDLVLGLS